MGKNCEKKFVDSMSRSNRSELAVFGFEKVSSLGIRRSARIFDQ